MPITTFDMAEVVDAVPVVADATARAALFPSPRTDQRVKNKAVGGSQRYSGSAWVSDFVQLGFNVADAGATGDGSTDDAAALDDAQTKALAAGILALTLPAGTYKIASNKTFTVALHFQPGAKLAPTSTHTVTISGGVVAYPRQQIFTTGAGTIVLGGLGTRPNVYPEWWGGKGDDATDNTAALLAAINAATNTLTQPGTVQLLRGIYRYTTLGNLACAGLTIAGNTMLGSVLKCTAASGDAIHIDAFASGSPSDPFIEACNLQNITVEGNANITNIFNVQGLARSPWQNVNAREGNSSTGIAYNLKGVMLSEWRNVICSTNVQSMSSVPSEGLRLSAGTRAGVSVGNSSEDAFTSCHMEGLQIGTRLSGCDQATFIDSASENNSTYDLLIATGSRYNTFIGGAYETASNTANVSDGGQYTRFINCYTTNLFQFASTARQCTLEGGTHQNITIQSGADGCITESLGLNKSGSGVYTNSGTNTQWKLLWDLTNAAYLFPHKARTSITVTASPFTFTNTSALPVQVIMQSGTVSQVQGKRGGDTWLLPPTPPQAYLVQPSDALVVTYSVSPAMSQLPVNGF